ncbi:hypothetical protein [Nocardioides sp. TF02-7]|uniref:hypothetical protein n=1 Tax=Nocardioides sp. TF02-7 TaxID=2917724 RepID=UPI001F05E1EB|nr:hypothetical protein [Nocardioides sp. TF02-7]UMG93811.1 hypothetical protein MF408_06620 [Nocardioides sp. TF02-7]
MGGVEDERLRAAVATSRQWYDEVHALHHRPALVEDDVWRTGRPLPWHSQVVTLAPTVGAGHVLAAFEGDEGSVADSFARLDLRPQGFDVLFEARWLHRDPPAAPPPLPDGWSVVRSAGVLAEWADRHDYRGVLTEDVLDHPRLWVLSGRRSGRLVAGAVVHDTPAAVGLSNVWARERSDVGDAVRAAQALHPGRPLTGYARGEQLARLLAEGFAEVGTHRVWVRSVRPSAPSR